MDSGERFHSTKIGSITYTAEYSDGKWLFLILSEGQAISKVILEGDIDCPKDAMIKGLSSILYEVSKDSQEEIDRLREIIKTFQSNGRFYTNLN